MREVMTMRLCPLAHRGVDLLAACPGYEPLTVRFGDGPGEGLAVTTCGHLAANPTSRGFAAHCDHPDAEAVVPLAVRAADSIPRVRRLTLLGRESRPLPAETPASTRREPASLTAPLVEDVRVGPITLVPLRTSVKGPVDQVALTLAEWQLMVALVLRVGVVMSRSALAGDAWGRGFAGRHSEVEVYISRLRRKLARAGTPDLIRTVRGEGYRLDLDSGNGASADARSAAEELLSRMESDLL